ncbi:sigma factor [Microbispora sp. ATCC PTA-5024]|uniref:sigma factor n=1 Tax=Microbispora sp. ATCC PTA-5024 TaxID=316330 RepID=UPI0003DCF457|nr:sigma factor [Microbispora sp. ATCC PTA-5024]ETK34700.1 hypothetical protein MPTA5024_18195 [Microbispora sp. ATCC PTA-5024]
MELIEAVRRGDSSAYGLLYQRHAAAARSLARQLVQGDDEAEDLLVETFARVLEIVREGGGPPAAFRPYLLTALRRYAATGRIDAAEPWTVHVHPDLAGLERSPLARAYLSLPERFRMVLWHAEVEGAAPEETAPLLGMSAGGVGGLARAAREALRHAYVRIHLEGGPGRECLGVLPKISRHVEGGLPPAEARLVDEHVAECIDCRSVLLELADVTRGLRVVVGQLIAGPVVDDYLADLARQGGAAPGGPVAAARRALTGRPRLSELAGLLRPARPEHARPSERSRMGSSWAGDLLRGVPTPVRAVLAGVLAATVATAAFLLVAQPMTVRPVARQAALPAPPRTEPTLVPGPSPASPAPTADPGDDRDGAGRPGRRRIETRAPRRAEPSVPRERARKAGAAALVASIDPLGALLRAQSGLIAVRLRNAGAVRSGDVEAAVTLPRGVTLVSSGRHRSGARTADGWACRTGGRVVRCGRGALAPGEVTAIFLRVAVAADAPIGRGPGVAVRSEGVRAAATAVTGVRASGAAARFAADGRVVTRVVGNTLVSAAVPPSGCAPGDAGPAEDVGVAIPVDLDDDDTTESSSCARLDLPAGGRVLWAGLYWAAGGHDVDPGGEIRLRPPGAAEYGVVRAAEIARRDLPDGSGYQAFADVTSLVRAAGSGSWWAADPTTLDGAVRHAGWSLVVMATDERQPYTRAVVLDAAAVVDESGGSLRIPLDGLAPVSAPARIDLVVWNGQGVKGGVVTLSDRSRPGGGERRRGGALDLTAGGTAVAVDTIHALLGPHPVLRLTTRRNSLFFGVAVVSARTWS